MCFSMTIVIPSFRAQMEKLLLFLATTLQLSVKIVYITGKFYMVIKIDFWAVTSEIFLVRLSVVEKKP